MLKDAENLIQRARDGDTQALERLLVAYSPFLSKCIAERFPVSLRSVTSVEDLVQEALVEAFTKIDRLRNTSVPAFTAWLKAIGQTTIIGCINKDG